MDTDELGHFAANGNVTQVKKLLHSKMIDVNKKTLYRCNTLLHYAAVNGHIVVIQVLLGTGANPNVTNRFGKTPLHKAAEHGHKEILQLLLDEGGDPNLKDIDGNTPLHKLALKG